MAQYTKTDCKLYDTEYCKILGVPGCEECTLRNSTEQEAESVRADIDIVRSLLPGGSVASLHETDSCQFCRGVRQQKSCYALTDYAHPKPERKKTTALGFKVKSRVGSIIPLQIACCSKCRSNILFADRIKFLVACGGIALALIVLGMQPVREALAKIGEIVPLLVLVAAVLLSYFGSRLIAKSYRAKKSAQTQYDINQIPFIAQMVENGWFCATDDHKPPRVIFSKEKLKRGWFT